MLAQIQLDFLNKAFNEASASGHIFPKMAACEAALESGYGHSGLAIHANNLFGMKQHSTPIYDTLDLPTHEVINGKWVVVTAHWVKYPDWKSCFNDRMDTLKRLAPKYVHYNNALNATDEFVYIKEVSKTWSTDPQRAAKVIAIYNVYV